MTNAAQELRQAVYANYLNQINRLHQVILRHQIPDIFRSTVGWSVPETQSVINHLRGRPDAVGLVLCNWLTDNGFTVELEEDLGLVIFHWGTTK